MRKMLLFARQIGLSYNRLNGCIFWTLVASLMMLLCQSCSADAGDIAQKVIGQAEQESMEVFAAVSDSDEGIPAGDLPRLNYAREQAGLKASRAVSEKLKMDDETKYYSAGEHAHRRELVDSAHMEIDRYYDPLIINELQRIEGSDILCYYDKVGIGDVEAKIEHVQGTRHIRIRLEGTMTRKGRYLHYRLHSAISDSPQIGATKLFNMDKSIKRILNMPGERVYCYIVLHRPLAQATNAVEITRIND